jgi:hypothetical protein
MEVAVSTLQVTWGCVRSDRRGGERVHHLRGVASLTWRCVGLTDGHPPGDSLSVKAELLLNGLG